jgi:ElaB/YqjD/DUF883 family membrane-anchored ribosome-binding protein
MNAEELTQEQKEASLHFDAHEFDGLREALEREAEGFVGQIDDFVREHPVTCMLIAAAAGFALATAAGAVCSRRESGAE